MNNFKIEMPAKVDGGVLKGILDVIHQRGFVVTVHARGTPGRRKTSSTTATKPTHKIVLECSLMSNEGKDK